MKSIIPFLLTLLTIIVGAIFYMASHFSLSFYFAITAFYLLSMTLFCKSRLPDESNKKEPNPTHTIALLTYLGVAVLSLMVFSNYYQAKGDVYYNTNHHALAWKGYQLPESGLLFGQNADAFLQDTATTGIIRFELQKNDSGEVTRIHLTATDMNRSFFTGEKGETDGATAIYYNKNTTLSAIGNEGIIFLNTVDSTQLRLKIIEKPNSPGWNIIGGPERDSVLYVFCVTDRKDSILCSDTVHSGLLIQKSYAISNLMPVNTVSVFGNNMEAFNIVREHYRTEEGPFTLSNYGWLKRTFLKLSRKHKSFRNQQYLVEQVQNNKEVVIIGGTAHSHHFETTLMPGDPFFIGFGSNGTPRMYFSQKGQLLFDLPQWRPLSSEKSKTDMLVTSSDFVVCNPKDISPYNILFNAPQVDRNDSEKEYLGNNNMFTTNISYAKGSTQELMRLSIENDKIVEANQDFLVPCHSGDNALAILQLTDFKSESAFQPKSFFKTILWIFLLASLSILFSTKRILKEGKIYRIIMPTITEIACIVLLMVLFTTRYIMCWRLSVFPPFEDISRHEYISFINNKVVHHCLTTLLVWILALLPLAKFILLNWNHWKIIQSVRDSNSSKRTVNADRHKYLRVVSQVLKSRWLPALVALVLEPVTCMFLPRGAQILLPVVAYFLLDIYLTYIFIEERAENTEDINDNLRYYLQFPFILNFVAHLILLIVIDAGYGVMFLLFGVIRYYLSLARWALRNKETKKIWWFLVLGGTIAILCFFYFSASIVAAMMNNPMLGNTVFIIVGALGILFLFWGFDESFNHKIFSKPIYSIGVVIVSVVFSIVLVSTTHAYNYVLGPDGHYTHIRYRTKVLVEDWKDILNNERVSNAHNISRFRQTSENQWILDHYYENRPQGEDPYFQMQPMSKRGAMWGAQTTDLSFLRFGIGEHGMSFATGIILLMLLVCAIAMWQPKSPHLLRKEARHNIAIGALLLILMQAIFVWMSVTNKFIFFGQDFPMLSITSKMTIYYVLFLLIFASLFSIPDPEELPKVFNKNEKKLSIIFTGLLAVFCIFLHVYQGQDRKNKNLESYELELNSVKKVLHVHNSLLRYYQIQDNNAYNRLILSTRGGYNLYGQKLFTDFNDNVYLNLDEEHEDIPSPDCIIDSGTESQTTKLPLVTAGSNLYRPIMDFCKMRRKPNSMFLAMSPDSVTLQLVFPQDSLYTPQERSLIRELNSLFTSYQIENRSLHLAHLYVNRTGKVLKEAVQNENKAETQENAHLLNTNDFTAMMTDYQSFLASARQNKGQSKNVTLDTLLARIDNVDKFEGATFTNSLIEAYMNNYAKNNSPGNIIYIRRDRDTGYLQFNINSNFFKIDMDKSLWRGDIIASDAEANNLLLVGSQNRQEYGDQKHYDHFDIARIPSSWLQGEKDQFLFCAYDPIRLQLKLRAPVELPYKKLWSTVRLSDTDGAKVIETSDKVSVRLPDDLHHVFAKNIWVNGKRRHIYPLGKALFWMKPYSDYVSSVMEDSIKADNTQATALSHVISLDYSLSDSLYQFVASIGEQIYNTESNDKYKQANLSVFVGNSDGEILAMPEFNGDRFFRINPNDHASIAKVQNRSTLFSDYTDERNLNGNQNLLPLSIGPGSSLKPLTFGAVSSTFDPGWNSFRLVGSLGRKAADQSVHRYAEKEFLNREHNFSSTILGDEPLLYSEFDIAEYLTHSSNFFNSAITFIGSFSELSLQKGIFKRANSIEQYGRTEFPVMRVSGKLVKFGAIFAPNEADTQPILMKRFYDNYGVYSEPTLVDEAYLDRWTLDPILRASSKNLSNKKKSQRWLMPAEAWAIPEPSFIDFPLRANDAELSYAQKIKTITLGMRRVVSVTPLKMAEMFGRMFLLDNKFRFTISNPERYQSNISYNVPAYDNVPNGYLKMLQAERSFFQGMRGCATTGGTAKYLKDLKIDNEPLETCQRLFVYAKTGTIDNNNNNQANMLAVIITNADMQQVRIKDGKMVTPEDKPLKFYVIYIAQDKTLKRTTSRGLKKSFQTGVVQTVINSSGFHQFFSLN